MIFYDNEDVCVHRDLVANHLWPSESFIQWLWREVCADKQGAPEG